jgi:hypothetical protein
VEPSAALVKSPVPVPVVTVVQPPPDGDTTVPANVQSTNMPVPFVSSLAALGVGAKELQTLARHSDPRLTLGLYTHARSAELARAVGRLKVPGSAEVASPLAHLDREQLEGITLGLLVLLGTLLSPAGDFAGQTSVTPRVTPTAGNSGDSREPLETGRRGRRVVG